MKIITIVGARPQFIKAAVVSRAIREYNRSADNSGAPVIEIMIHTGQHYDDNMSAVFFRDLRIPEPKYNLGIGSSLHGEQTGAMLAAIERILLDEKPDCVVIYGDTNSTLAGALTAVKHHIPVAHVEAGLRSFNRRMPEEINRIVADHVSTYLFCPSQAAVDNLAREGIQERVHLAGDVMHEALVFAASNASASSDVLTRFDLKEKGFLLVTVHRAENTDDPMRLSAIIAALGELSKMEPVIFPAHPRTRKAIEAYDLVGHAADIRFVDPLGYMDMVRLEQSARVILTDSGGIQKEAYWLGVPCVTLRDQTEWVETVRSGWNVLAKADRDEIIRTLREFVPPSSRLPLYADKEAAARILRVITGIDVVRGADSQP